MTEQQLFKRFARERRNAAAYDAGDKSEEAQLFAVSLSSFQDHLAWTRSAINKQDMGATIIPGYIDLMTLNAFADYHGGTHYIGMHQALFVTILEFAYYCFAQRGFFPGIGNASLETSPEPIDDQAPGLWLLDQTVKGMRTIPHRANRILPNDPERSVAAVYLALLMVRFVWLHEMAHCMNGHVHYVQSKDLSQSLNEIASQEVLGLVKPVPARNIQKWDAALRCLEYDADQTAFWGSCQIQIGGNENIQGIAAMDITSRLELTVFGTYAMTWLFETYQNYFKVQYDSTHPQPVERLQSIFNYAARHITPQEPDFITLQKTALQQFNTIRQKIPAVFDMRKLEIKPLADEKLLANIRKALLSYRYDVNSTFRR